jgi:uncharacterized membrane protein
MIESIDAYLNALKAELADSDPAIIQDALADAEEHLRSALDNARETRPEGSEADALPAIVAAYGAPDEVAAAYRELEIRVRPALAPSTHPEHKGLLARFFGVLADPRAWGALIYLLFSLVTGMAYFTWAVAGLTMSLSLLILIIGVPFLVLFLLSVRGIALVEGRVVEALLGVRMPRRSWFFGSDPGWWDRLKSLFLDRRTWTSIAYLLLQLPLGLLYFTVFLVMISFSLSLLVMPVAGPLFDRPVIMIDDMSYYVPYWLTPLVALVGLALIAVTMHLAKLVGRTHGALAKALLVSG